MFGDDIKAMVNTLGNDLRSLLRAILLLGFAGGLRRSEIVGRGPADRPAPLLLLSAGSAWPGRERPSLPPHLEAQQGPSTLSVSPTRALGSNRTLPPASIPCVRSNDRPNSRPVVRIASNDTVSAVEVRKQRKSSPASSSSSGSITRFHWSQIVT
ncbi:hypothetical protein EJ071_36850 [Mesorhizobium sp. M1B.F.Ca.ET.045.04.1.1]|nr:hypothetical protein EJ071_36850 [Mesorhizobium sp. M1B.F.Ca.ET.045.04.1.1]